MPFSLATERCRRRRSFRPSDFQGWASVDVTHACFQSAQYCRLAIGRDYDSAAPVRGVRRGGGMESMEVHVSVVRR